MDGMEEIVENVTLAAAQNESTKQPATPEGMIIAYSSLMVMALLPIYYGSFRSLKLTQETKAKGEKMESSISKKDAMAFPIIASVTLFSLYIVYKLIPKEYVTVVLMSYFFILGVLAVAHVVSPMIVDRIPDNDYISNLKYHLLLTRGSDGNKESMLDVKFCTYDMLVVAFCSLIGVLHLWKRHWLTNNLFGLAFSLNGIELIHLSSFRTGAMLLAGLFFYDIFWVFKTDVMVTVAKNVEAPIKLMFPQDLLEKGLAANNCAMLGLGDIVIPGIFIALLLRYDYSKSGGRSRAYFWASFIAYFLGLMLTIFVMHVFKHAQPALLYLVPACLSAPALVSVVKGELPQLINYNEDDMVQTKEKKTG